MLNLTDSKLHHLGNVPTPTTADNGKVLKASITNGNVTWILADDLSSDSSNPNIADNAITNEHLVDINIAQVAGLETDIAGKFFFLLAL